MKEFAFYSAKTLATPLSDEIEILSQRKSSQHFLVANKAEISADIIAPEVDFYLNSSQASALQKSSDVLKLYEMRAMAFDLALDMDYEKFVGKKVALVSNSQDSELESEIKKAGFDLQVFSHFEVKFVYGCAGELSLVINQGAGEMEVQADLLLALNAQNFMLRQSGCFEISGLSRAEILNILHAHSPKYAYKNYISYDESICQYAGRREEICGRCADICPSVAILKDDEVKKLVFSHIDCVACGLCVGVCPSGSLDSAKLTKQAFGDIAQLFEDRVAFVVDESFDFSANLSLKPEVLPFVLPSLGLLSQSHLLSLAQNSGSQVVIYSPKPAQVLLEAIKLVNDIYMLKFASPAILLASTKEELQSRLEMASTIANSKLKMNEYAKTKREIFAQRVGALVGQDSLGSVKSGELIRYAKVEVDADGCTLCLSCAGACNVGALIADSKTNSLKFNASICTACGYCQPSCAEPGVLKFTPGELVLEPASFEFVELARDELFGCIECGKEFATKKAIERVAAMLAPKFAGDEKKLRSLYCCADCKARIMLEAANFA